MRIYTFKGGIQPTSKKENIKDASVQNVLPGKEMIYPLSISKDEVAFPMVVEDEYVQRGQKIAEYNKEGKALYSSVSGYVKKIETRIWKLFKIPMTRLINWNKDKMD
jgi:electron transport complex protein RnfC